MTLFELDQSHLASLKILTLLLTLSAIPLLLYAFTYLAYNLFLHPLRSYPGPKLWAATRIPCLIYQARGRLPYHLRNAHDRYGPVVRIAPNELSYTDAIAFKDIYGHRQGRTPSQLTKDPFFYGYPPPGKPASIIIANDADHSRYRRHLAHAFSAKALQEQEPLMKQYIDLLIQRLNENRSKGPQNMVAWYNWTTFDLIGDLAFGEPFGCLENQDWHPWVSMLFGAVKINVYLSILRRLGLENSLKYILPSSIKGKRDEHIKLSAEKTNRRIVLDTDRHDFMHYVLKNRHDKEIGIADEEIQMNSSILIIAGSETTATLLSGATYYLLKNPAALATAVKEVRDAFGKEEEIDLIATNKLKYLLAVLNESLRMYPPIPIGLPRIVIGDGDTIAGQWVPGGTVISVSHYSTYRSANNFRDPDSFLPQRWLDNNATEFASDNKEALQPFSLGPRNCLGKNLAYAEMRLILARVLWNFDLELVRKPGDKDWADHRVFNLWEKGPLMANLKPANRTT